MKIAFGIFSLVLSGASAQAQSGVSLGELTLGGTACRLEVGDVEASLDNGVLKIPLASIQQKESGENLARGACSFALPVKVAKGFRLVARDLLAIGQVNLSKTTTSQIQLEIFSAGTQGEVLKRVDGSESKKIRKNIYIRQSGDVFVSECGESFLLRGNSSILLQGQAKASAALHLVQLDVEVEKCL